VTYLERRQAAQRRRQRAKVIRVFKCSVHMTANAIKVFIPNLIAAMGTIIIIFGSVIVAAIVR